MPNAKRATAPHERREYRSSARAARSIIAAAPDDGIDNVAGLIEAQAEYAAWLDSLPDSLQDSATADALRAICELDLTELQAIEPPRGFGRD